MGWQKIESVPIREHRFDAGPVRLTVADTAFYEPGERLWQHMILSLGRHTKRPESECVKSWPREALELARRALDEFEKTLEENEL